MCVCVCEYDCELGRDTINSERDRIKFPRQREISVRCVYECDNVKQDVVSAVQMTEIR